MQSKLEFLVTEVEECTEWCTVCLLMLEQAQDALDEAEHGYGPPLGFDRYLLESAVEMASSAHKAAEVMLADATEALEAFEAEADSAAA